jgi:two-component system phosphate regulon response regulator PhoB
VHGETTFVFVPLGCDGPAKLVDGRCWAFVQWVLDKCSGLELVRRLRADPRTAHAHITLLLDQEGEEHRRRALDAGADDYALAPLNRQAILDRVLALVSGNGAPRSERVIDLGDLTINLGSELARWRGKAIGLRPNEFRVLRFLAENPNRVYSRAELIHALGKDGDPDYLRTVDVWIKRLRFGLRAAGAPDLLRTVHGKGYVLDLL